MNAQRSFRLSGPAVGRVVRFRRPIWQCLLLRGHDVLCQPAHLHRHQSRAGRRDDSGAARSSRGLRQSGTGFSVVGLVGAALIFTVGCMFAALIFTVGCMFGVSLSLLGAIVSPYLATQAPSLANPTNGPPAFFLLFIVGSIFLASNSLVSSRIGALSPSPRRPGVPDLVAPLSRP
jgi:hypothetical protein